MKTEDRKTTAIAPSNIAFIKYWGKTDELLNIPQNSSLSVNFDNLLTTTTVEFDQKLKKDIVSINGRSNPKETDRVVRHLNIIRNLGGAADFAKVVSTNNFPIGCGLASSASGFAALTLAGTKALKLNLSEKELTTIARLGSGSAARSIPSGFVKWEKGTNHKNSYARTIYPKNYWDLQMIAVILSDTAKKVGSTEGHGSAKTSPLYPSRLKNMPGKIKSLEKALKAKDFPAFGQIVEEEALEMHAVMITSSPSLIYFLPESIQIMHLCRSLREKGTEVYFTFDAGPQPVLFCLEKDAKKVLASLKGIKGIKRIIVSNPGDGARLTEKHLF